MATNGQSILSLPVFITLAEAARKYDISEDALTRLIRCGRIEAARLPSGDVVVQDRKDIGRMQVSDHLKHKTKAQVIQERFAHLRGKAISGYRAAQEYGISHRTIIRWARAGHIRIMGSDDRSLELDAADVAYCAYVYEEKKRQYDGNIIGVRIFDDIGNPYQVKYPELSAVRRKVI
jgi:hypothetical protein